MTKNRAIGIDIGAESIKIVSMEDIDGKMTITNNYIEEHCKKPAEKLNELLIQIGQKDSDYICCTGSYSLQMQYSRIPAKVAMAKGARFLFGPREDLSVLSISSQGYELLEICKNGTERMRRNPRCSEGTGNFLRQLINRLGVSFEDADSLCHDETSPISMPGRCPVIIKTRMTHLANNGESKSKILAGLFDLISDNATSLIKLGKSPENLVLTGGVCQIKRIRDRISNFAESNNIKILNKSGDYSLFIEAIGCALNALEFEQKTQRTILHRKEDSVPIFNKGKPLPNYLHLVKRINSNGQFDKVNATRDVVIGLDIGSTGSKIVAYDYRKKIIQFEHYVDTKGGPIKAIKQLIEKYQVKSYNKTFVRGFGVTGSGRDAAFSLLSTLYGDEYVHKNNEIVAHARGATFFDSDVDTIFELGGQDAKYIRLKQGKVIDAAMNETCSAGTGSFIEEQGLLFEGISDITDLSHRAIAAEYSVSLGNHCSVFMADLINKAIVNGDDHNAIIAGIYDSVALNYLQRVKGQRIIGNKVFCQGMPFKSDALAAAFARNIGSEILIPPNPDTVGALGIAIIASERLKLDNNSICLEFINQNHEIIKESFTCKSNIGCKESANACLIERIKIIYEGKSKSSYWGGSCNLWVNRSANKRMTMNHSPNPFRERELLIDSIIQNLEYNEKHKSIALTDKFQLKSIFPFFATFFNSLGFNIFTESICSDEALKIGINNSEVLFCSPMMIYCGIIHSFAMTDYDFIFAPILINGPVSAKRNISKMCPVIQSGSDIVNQYLMDLKHGKLLRPKIEFGNDNFLSQKFKSSCKDIAKSLGFSNDEWIGAYQKALNVQNQFHADLVKIGENALDYCKLKSMLPIVILGKDYSIYNEILNSGVSGIIQSLGAMAIPMDTIDFDTRYDEFGNQYWNYAQGVLNTALKVRNTSGLYAIFCSNYSCGPDSFIQHFVFDIMDGKPMLMIESDVRTADSGIKTRIESFIECIKNDNSDYVKEQNSSFNIYNPESISLKTIIHERTQLLVPNIGPCSEALTACLRGTGIDAVTLPIPDNNTVAIGKRYTSGKECSPINATLGSLLQYFEQNKNQNQNFIYFMPGSDGPCRFGMYNVLQKLIVKRLGYQNRIKFLSSGTDNFVQDVPIGLYTLIYIAFCTIDAMHTAYQYVKPVEKITNKSSEIYEDYKNQLLDILKFINGFDISTGKIIHEIISGNLFGCSGIINSMCCELASNMSTRKIPSVSIDGALYIRCSNFANDFLADKLMQYNIRAIQEPFFSWLEFLDYTEDEKQISKISTKINRQLKLRIKRITNTALEKHLKMPKMPDLKRQIEAVSPYLNPEIISESMLSVGSSILQNREDFIDGLILVSPHECMPSKITEAQLHKISVNENLYFKTIQFANEPVDHEDIEAFSYDIHKLFRNRDL